MTPQPNQIPFSTTPPTEEGAYWWKPTQCDEKHKLAFVRVCKCCVTIFEEGFVRSGTIKEYGGLWSPRLIPITALEEAQKRIAELNDKIQELKWRIQQLEGTL